MASLMGAMASGDRNDATATLNAQKEIEGAFDSDDPEGAKAKFEVYKNAAEIFFDTDDLKELVPQPDKALPFLVAGAALIQAGNRGDTWGEALSTAFLNYAGAKRKEERAYKSSMLGLEMREKQDIRKFATEMYLADYKEQKALQRALISAEKKPYKVNNNPNPVFYTTHEAAFYERLGNRVVPWRAEDGDTKEYTIFADVNKDGQPDANAPARTQLLSEVGALNKQVEGYIVREGNLTKGKKLHMVNDVPQMFTEEELDAFMKENPSVTDVRVVGVSNAKPVRNRITGELTWVDNRDLLTKRGQELYSPIAEGNTLVYGTDGNILMMQGSASELSTLQNKAQLGNEEARVREFLQQASKKRNDLLTTHYKIKKLVADQAAAGQPLAFGSPAGDLTIFGKSVIDQVDQLQQIFTNPEEGYRLYTDTNGNGRRDANETISTFNDFSNRFGYQFSNSNLGRYLQGAGLGRKRVNNAILTLALQGAANDDQKGRDISDKDIERYLIRAGADATSAEEFINVIDNLALTAIHKHESIVDSARMWDTRLQVDPQNPDQKMTMIDFMYPNLIDEQGNSRPFRDAPYTINELKEQLTQSTSVSNSTGYRPRLPPPIDFVVLSGGGVESGVGKAPIHEIFVRLMAQDDGVRMDDTSEFSPKQYGYLAKIREQMGGEDSPQWQQFNNYLNLQRQQQRLSP